ncbi:MAG: hypothetical protein R3E53_11470 [Myxococcota bacterium]
MWTLIECAGHPRDMGLAQGGAERAAIRRAISSLDLPLRRSRLPSLRPLISGPMRGSGAGRELFRHFAHQSERLEGLARGAGVPLDSLLELHLRVRAGGEAGGLLSRRAALRVSPAESGAGRVPVRLERSLPRAAAGEPGFLLRESRPVVGFRSVEVTLPWLVSSVAGVNEGGLAVIAGPMLWGSRAFSAGRRRSCSCRNVCSASKISLPRSTGARSGPSRASRPSCWRMRRAPWRV